MFPDLARRVRASVSSSPVSSRSADLIPSAVLLALVPRESGPSVIFTVRAMTVAKHKGQVSFPGGAAEPGDDGPAATALRESLEEIGLPPERVEVVGIMDDQPTTTGFVITPVVGFVRPPVTLVPDPSEVVEIFEAPLEALMDPANHETMDVVHRGVRFEDHRFHVGKHVIWGATGRIMYSFLRRLGTGGKHGENFVRHDADNGAG